MSANPADAPRRDGRRSVAFFSMPETGHFQRMESLIAGLARSGITANVFTHRRFEETVLRAGGVFHDLFAGYPLDEADDASFPLPCRFVSFAGAFAGAISRDVARTRPALVIHDSFAVIGRVVASLLGVPRVNVCAGHNVRPELFLTRLQADPRVRLSTRCLEAVEKLRDSYAMADASPFSYVSSLSPDLNIYCEPPQFLDEHEKKTFAPVAFYGSLPSRAEAAKSAKGRRQRVRILRVYVSFGTVVWRYYTDVALAALSALASAFARREDLRAVISLGGTPLGEEAKARLVRPNVEVAGYVEQWEKLRQTDLFVTHHGMNSTHEAIFHCVPMLSYPFFWDQPSLAEKCRRFGLAIPLTEAPRGTLDEEGACAALARFSREREAMSDALFRAREWELAVLANRDAVLQRVIDLMK